MIWNSRRLLILLTFSAGLTGCGASADPLSDALAALRAGDRAAFLVAKAKAVDVMQTAKSVAQMRCNGFDPMEFREHNEIIAIEALDRESLFAKGEDERLVYALNVAGYLKSDGAFLEAVLNYGSNAAQCPPLDAKQKAELQAATSKDQDMERARQNILSDWVSAKKREYGEDSFESNMKSAANRLTNVGLSSKWPTKVILAESN